MSWHTLLAYDVEHKQALHHHESGEGGGEREETMKWVLVQELVPCRRSCG